MVAQYVNDPHSSYPYSAIVHVTVTFSDGYTGSGSGVMVGRNDVLTASHVVYRPGASVQKMSIAPGSDGWNDHPFGTITSWGRVNYYEVDSVGDIMIGEAGWDVAIIGLKVNTGYETGWFGINSHAGTGSYNITGYPSAWNGTDGSPYMVTETNTASVDGTYSLIKIGNFDISPGSSGSPVWRLLNDEPYVYGVVSTRDWAADLGNTFQTVVGWMEGNDTLVAAAPDDYRGKHVFGTDGNDNLAGTALDDTMTGYLGHDTLSGRTGADIIYGNKGLDLLNGNWGDDTLYGGQNDGGYSGSPPAMRDGRETLTGAGGDDLVYGNHGGDNLSGGVGVDTLYGGQDDDRILGGDGNDRLYGNRGNDTLSGDTGRDHFYFTPNSGNDVITDFGNTDLIRIRYNVNGSGIFTPGDALDNITGDGSGNALIDLGAGNSITVLGYAPAAFNAFDFLIF